MAVIDDGGRAFPTTPHSEDKEYSYVCGGITVRDYFAANETSIPPDSWVASIAGSGETFSTMKGVDKATLLARWRYQCADAMIQARKATL